MDAYSRKRKQYQDISGTLIVAAATDDTTLVTGKTACTIFVQRVRFYVTTDAAQSLTVQDSAAPALVIAVVPASPGVNTPWVFDFGPIGMPLTEAKNLVMNVSAAGLAGNLQWEGYSRQTATAIMSVGA